MVFLETPTFARKIAGILTAEEYTALQQDLAANPTQGKVIPSCGGARKARCAAKGKGKSGGARIIYLYIQIADTIHLITAYTKSEASDITSDQKKAIRKLTNQLKQIYT
ncbi:hypothetical protein OpiT1DRAFT_04774 [Opitutaceae bacterium TAV1]|nr:hypothetical protein OpiT1DRAFT_04774 [Opitutaceae bacterium TAV1]